MSSELWQKTVIAPDHTHHLIYGKPLYTKRFRDVLEFHEPGLAAVVGDNGCYHIDATGASAYQQRYLRTFGFYGERAAVLEERGWLHILIDGTSLYTQRYTWCGNFQDECCTVRNHMGDYFHIDSDGQRLYREHYRYAGDFRKGIAVVQRDDGLSVHIMPDGSLLNGTAWLDLDIFHKGLARARDTSGWTHIDDTGRPTYPERYAMVEPFYNGQARVETHDGAILIISESGSPICELRPACGQIAALSDDLVGYWRTFTINAAVELGLFEALPATTSELDCTLRLAPGMSERLLRGLQELGLVLFNMEGRWESAERGKLLNQAHPFSMASATRLWAGAHLDAWRRLIDSLRTGMPAFEEIFGCTFFAWLAEHSEERLTYHQALSVYAKEDYCDLPSLIDLKKHHRVIDAGGGSGDLLAIVLRKLPHLKGVLLERPEVVRDYVPPPDLADRVEVFAADLFSCWPTHGDVIFLARVLHDWQDEATVCILRQAANSLDIGGHLFVIEGLLDDKSSTIGMLDLNMLVMTGGRERELNSLVKLLQTAGFRLELVHRLDKFRFILDSVLSA